MRTAWFGPTAKVPTVTLTTIGVLMSLRSLNSIPLMSVQRPYQTLAILRNMILWESQNIMLHIAFAGTAIKVNHIDLYGRETLYLRSTSSFRGTGLRVWAYMSVT